MGGKSDIVEQALKLVMVAGKEVAPKAKLPMDLDNRMYRASEMGFDPTRRYYHLTRKDFDAFKLGADPSSHTGGGAIWLRENPRYNISAHQVPSFEAEGAREIPLFIRPTKELPTMEWSLMRQQGKLNDQFPLVVTPEENKMLRDMGYSHASLGGETVVFDPKDLRSPHAVFDPDETESADYMKSSGGSIRQGYGPGGIIDDVVKMAGKIVSGEGEQAAKTGIRAYHGSPHDFDRFDMSKIGTGEGAQAYGHGLYFAGNEDVAREYRDALAKKAHDKATTISNIVTIDGQAIDASHPDFMTISGIADKGIDAEIAAAKARLQQRIDAGIPEDSPLMRAGRNVLDRLEKYRGFDIKRNVTVNEPNFNPGHMYEVNIAADPNQFLDWDKPLSEQPPSVQRALTDYMANLERQYKAQPGAEDVLWRGNGRDEEINLSMMPPEERRITEKTLQKSGYGRIMPRWQHELSQHPDFLDPQTAVKGGDPEKASKTLLEAGVPGVKYLDAGSRGAGEGTRNYVVFDDKLISIIRKYGIAGASAMLGYNLMENLDANQALAASMADQDYQASIPNKAYGGYVDDEIDDAIRIAKDVGGSTPVMMEDAKGNKYDAQGNVIPPTNPGPNPARSNVTPETVAAKAVNDPATFDALMERYAVPDRDIAQYEATKKAVAKQPYETQQMTHVGAKPERDVTVDMPLFGGEYSLGRAPYDVAGPMAGMAQTAYDWKTAPFYALPLTAPLAAGMDVAEGVATEDPLTASLAIGFGPGGKYAKAAGIGAANYLMAPEEAEAGPARWFSKAMEVARELPMNKMTGEQALAMLRKSVSPEELRLTGTDRFLNEQKQVTKQDIINYLDKTRAETSGIRAFHGSPHDFPPVRLIEMPDGTRLYQNMNENPATPEGAKILQEFPLGRFDISKIGTGEGAQAYGHGLYFAEHEPVAKGYRDALTPKNYLLNAPEPEIAAKHGQDVLDMFYYHGGDPNDLQETINRLKEQNKRDLLDLGLSDVSQVKPQNDWGIEASVVNRADRINRLQGLLASPEIKVNPGHMYEVNIAADPNTFLDWDKPLSEQPQYIQEILAKHTPLQKNRPYQQSDVGKDIYYKNAQGIGGGDIAAEELKRLGIPGIKYLDAGSRAVGEGTHNYVVFDDRLISIIRKYGIAGASAMLGYNLMKQLTPEQAKAATQADNDYQELNRAESARFSDFNKGGRVADPVVNKALALTSGY